MEDKNTLGRDPIIRTFNSLRKKGILEPVITFALLFFLIGINTTLHHAFAKGIIFFVVIFLTIITGKRNAIEFFGSSTIAVFVGLHIALYGLSMLALTCSFILYLLFRSFFERNLNYPVTIYLLLDSLILYIGREKYIEDGLEIIGRQVFNERLIILAFVFPCLATFYYLELWFEKNGKNNYVKEYGAFFVILAVSLTILILALLFSNQLLAIIGLVIFSIYCAGILTYKSSPVKTLFLFISAFLAILLLFIIRQSLT